METIVEIKAKSDQAISEIEKVKGSLGGLERTTKSLGQVSESIAPKTEKALSSFEARRLAMAAGGLLSVATGVKELGMATMMATGGITAICAAIGILTSVLGTIIQKSKQAKEEWKKFTDQLMADAGAIPGVAYQFEQLEKNIEQKMKEAGQKVKQNNVNIAQEVTSLVEQMRLPTLSQANTMGEALATIGAKSHETMKAWAQDVKQLLSGELNPSVMAERWGVLINPMKEYRERVEDVIEATKNLANEMSKDSGMASNVGENIANTNRKLFMEKRELYEQGKISFEEYEKFLTEHYIKQNQQALQLLEHEYQVNKKIREQNKKEIQKENKKEMSEEEKRIKALEQTLLNTKKQSADEALKAKRQTLLEEAKDTERYYELQKQFLNDDYQTKIKYYKDILEKETKLSKEAQEAIGDILKSEEDKYKAELERIEISQKEFIERQEEKERKRREQEEKERQEALRKQQEEHEKRIKEASEKLAGYLEPIGEEFQNLIFGMEASWKRAMKSMAQTLIHELINMAIKKAALSIVNLITGLFTGGLGSIGGGMLGAGDLFGALAGIASVGYGGLASAYAGVASTPYRQLAVHPITGSKTTIYNVNVAFQTQADRRYVESVLLPIFQDLAREGR